MSVSDWAGTLIDWGRKFEAFKRFLAPGLGRAETREERREMRIERPNQVWAMDITYIPMARGFVSLAAVVDWWCRCLWRQSPHAREQLLSSPGRQLRPPGQGALPLSWHYRVWRRLNSFTWPQLVFAVGEGEAVLDAAWADLNRIWRRRACHWPAETRPVPAGNSEGGTNEQDA